jgi:hypothetical protein
VIDDLDSLLLGSILFVLSEVWHNL